MPPGLTRTMALPFSAAALKALAAEAGLTETAAANVMELAGCLDRAAWFPRPRSGTEGILPTLKTTLPDAAAGSFLACALPHPAPAGGADADTSRAVVAAFARADYYRAAVRALRRTARRVREGTDLAKSDLRIFVNSRIPEKPIACAAGLGDYGRNRLLFHPRYGSRFVIGLLFLPFRLEGRGDERVPAGPDIVCGACTACLSACPASALGPGEPPSLPRCLKTRSDTLRIWDDETRRAWGRRLYGCDTCQDVCPKNSALPPAPPLTEGALGQGIDIAFILSLSEEECRRYFKKTALGLSWIRPEVLLRNALCAAGNSGRPSLLGAVRRHRDNPRPALADMAAWAEKKLSGGG